MQLTWLKECLSSRTGLWYLLLGPLFRTSGAVLAKCLLELAMLPLCGNGALLRSGWSMSKEEPYTIHNRNPFLQNSSKTEILPMLISRWSGLRWLRIGQKWEKNKLFAYYYGIWQRATWLESHLCFNPPHLSYLDCIKERESGWRGASLLSDGTACQFGQETVFCPCEFFHSLQQQQDKTIAKLQLQLHSDIQNFSSFSLAFGPNSRRHLIISNLFRIYLNKYFYAK